jgi:Protein of unknown function (DUF1682)
VPAVCAVSAGRPRLCFQYKLGRNNDMTLTRLQMGELDTLMAVVCQFIDIVGSYQLPPEARKKAEKRRQEVRVDPWTGLAAKCELYRQAIPWSTGFTVTLPELAAQCPCPCGCALTGGRSHCVT